MMGAPAHAPEELYPLAKGVAGELLQPADAFRRLAPDLFGIDDTLQSNELRGVDRHPSQR
jgi:hypothetical protein